MRSSIATCCIAAIKNPKHRSILKLHLITWAGSSLSSYYDNHRPVSVLKNTSFLQTSDLTNSFICTEEISSRCVLIKVSFYLELILNNIKWVRRKIDLLNTIN